MKKIFFIITSLIINSIFCQSQNLPSDYLDGYTKIGEKKIDILFTFDEDNGKKNAYLYVPEQFIYADKANVTTISNDSIYIKINKLSLEITGQIKKDSLTGTFKQGRAAGLVNLKFVNKKDVEFLNRPQTPKPPFPYIEKELVIENKKGGVKLGGTLTIPDTTGKYPLVVLITGSGAQNRDSEIGGHRSFYVIADYLTRNGIAVFRYDDRGVGETTGSIINSTTKDFAGDAEAIIKYFKKHPNINPRKTGLIGHSEGGAVAMICAAENKKDISFIISLAGQGVSSKEILVKQNYDIYKAEGIDEDTISILMDWKKELFDLPGKTKDMTELRKETVKIFDHYGSYFDEGQKEKYGITPSNITLSVMQFSSTWMQYYLTIDPSQYMKKIKCPVLAINGDKDIQVEADINLEAIKKNLEEGKCEYFELYKMEGLNHLFQHAEKGTVEEYYMIQETFSEEVLKIMKDFILKIN